MKVRHIKRRIARPQRVLPWVLLFSATEVRPLAGAPFVLLLHPSVSVDLCAHNRVNYGNPLTCADCGKVLA